MTRIRTSPERSPTAANRLGLDYRRAAASMPAPCPIVDVHTHVNGAKAAALYDRITREFGIELTYSMTRFEDAEAVRGVMGDRIRFIAVPSFHAEDRKHALGRGFIELLPRFHDLGARIAKFWVAPRSIDYAKEMGDPDCMRLDAPVRIEAMELAADLGMAFMVHVADPDTWFRTRYADASIYGSKPQQYEPLERLLDRFAQPWIAAHMGGWPEDLAFLDGLLDRHANLYLDTSATKWMVRELSRHEPADLQAFLRRHEGRILFGTDNVTSDDHLHTHDMENEMARKAGSEDEAYDLYASRFWALRTLWESDYDGPSPIADPDLALVDPDRYDAMDAPRLRGMQVPKAMLQSLYHDAARALLDPLHRRK